MIGSDPNSEVVKLRVGVPDVTEGVIQPSSRTNMVSNLEVYRIVAFLMFQCSRMLARPHRLGACEFSIAFY